MAKPQIFNPHSISFNDGEHVYNTWDNWFLVPSSRPYVAPPDVKTEYVEIPGMNGALDFTETLSGRPIFGMRKGNWEFQVLSKYDGADQIDWADLYSTILMAIHGRTAKVILKEDDPLFYYTGRIIVNDWKSDKERSIITLSYTLDPYKTPIITDDIEEWKWDELFGISKIIYGTFTVNGYKTRTIINASDEPILIKTDSTARMIAAIYESESSDTIKTNVIIPVGITEDNVNFTVQPGRTKIRFEGYGTIKLYYDRGRSL